MIHGSDKTNYEASFQVYENNKENMKILQNICLPRNDLFIMFWLKTEISKNRRKNL